MKETEPEYGEIVEIPWGNRYTVRARVNEVYGHSVRHAVVILTPRAERRYGLGAHDAVDSPQQSKTSHDNGVRSSASAVPV